MSRPSAASSSARRINSSVLGYDTARWSEFALAQLGASAALLGLVFVALSINLRDVVGSQPLVNRAAEAVVVLASVLVTATVVLIPGQERGVLIAEMLAVAIVTSVAVLRLERGSRGAGPEGEERGPSPFQVASRRAMCVGAQLLLMVAAITLATEAGGGLYWWPAAVIAAYAGALGNAWVLLIEILR